MGKLYLGTQTIGAGEGKRGTGFDLPGRLLRRWHWTRSFIDDRSHQATIKRSYYL